MNLKPNKIVIASLLFISSALYASETITDEKNFYSEIGYLPLTVHFPYNVTLEPKLVRYVFGVKLHEHLDLEGIVGATTDSDNSVRANIGGIFMRPKVAMTEDSTVFLRFGPARTSLDGRASGSLTRIAYGFGFQTKIGDNLYWQVDYMHYGSNEAHKIVRGGTISLGMTF